MGQLDKDITIINLFQPLSHINVSVGKEYPNKRSSKSTTNANPINIIINTMAK